MKYLIIVLMLFSLNLNLLAADHSLNNRDNPNRFFAEDIAIGSSFFFGSLNIRNLGDRISSTLIGDNLKNDYFINSLSKEVEKLAGKKNQKAKAIFYFLKASDMFTGRASIWMYDGDDNDFFNFGSIFELKPDLYEFIEIKSLLTMVAKSVFFNQGELTLLKDESDLLLIKYKGVDCYIKWASNRLLICSSKDEINRIVDILVDGSANKESLALSNDFKQYSDQYSHKDIITFLFFKDVFFKKDLLNSVLKTKKISDDFKGIKSAAFASYVNKKGFKDEIAIDYKTNADVNKILRFKEKNNWKTLNYLYDHKHNIISLGMCFDPVLFKEKITSLAKSKDDSKLYIKLIKELRPEDVRELVDSFEGELGFQFTLNPLSSFYEIRVALLLDDTEGFESRLNKISLSYQEGGKFYEMYKDKKIYRQNFGNHTAYYLGQFPIIPIGSCALITFPGLEDDEIDWFWGEIDDIRNNWDSLMIWENFPKEISFYCVADFSFTRILTRSLGDIYQNDLLKKLINEKNSIIKIGISEENYDKYFSYAVYVDKILGDKAPIIGFYIGKENGLIKIGSYSPVPLSPLAITGYHLHKKAKEHMEAD